MIEINFTEPRKFEDLSIDEKLDVLFMKMENIQNDIDTTRNIAEKVHAEVKPTLDAIMGNSMFKMILGSKK